MNDILVTDHALLRWLERAHDLDIEEMRQRLAKIAQPYADLRVAEAEIGGLYFVFRDDKLITVKPNPTKHFRHVAHDKGNVNGSQFRDEKPHWKMLKRRRDHR